MKNYKNLNDSIEKIRARFTGLDDRVILVILNNRLIESHKKLNKLKTNLLNLVKKT